MLLNEVLERGFVKVGINGFAPGFSEPTASGGYTGFDIDWARSLAAALFGDANKVELVKLDFSQSFDKVTNNVVNGVVDVIATPTTVRNTWDTNLKIDFSPIHLYNTQQIAVRANRNIQNIYDLEGLTIGTYKSTNAGQNLVSFLKAQGINFTLKEYQGTELIAAYAKGEIDAVSSDRSLLFSSFKLLPDPKNHKILDTEISQEPLAVIVPENDSEWADVVKWVTYAPVQAEEFGITSENIDDVIANSTNPAIRRFLGLEDNLGEKLGLNKDFVAKIVKQMGNYGEIYERNFPGLERDRNSLWQNDGLLYSPPFAGTLPNNFTLTNNDNRNLLQKVKERGVVQLGVTGNSPAFAVQQVNGEWIGFDIELGKAIAAAVFGDASKLKVVVQNFSQGFDDVANGVIDIFAAGITQNLVRDAARGVDFSPTYLYTGQGFLVREDSGINFLSDLNGRTIGLTSSTSGLQNIQDYFAEIGGSFRPEIFSNTAAMFAAYQRGEVDAISTDQTIIAGLIPTLANPDQHKLLNSIISKEPLALAIDENQSEWADLVRWVTYSLVQAEELGISSTNIENLVKINTDQNVANDSTEQIRTLLGIESNIGVGLGVSNDFVINLLKAVGNYGEIYERNFGGSILSREQNQLYTDFGLQFSPPFTATPTDINEPPTPSLTLSESGKNLLRLNGLNNAKIEVVLTDKHVGISNVHEVGLFVVDDAQGRVKGLLPSDPGYLQAALSLSQTIFSVVSREFVPDPIRNLDNFKGQLLSFYLVQNGSTDEVVNNPAAQGKVLFGAANNNLQIQGLDSNQFQLTFEDQLGDSSADLMLTVRLTETAPPLASNLQGKAERQLIDLRDFGEQSIQAVFPIVKGEAAYKNTAGFYKVENEQGTVLDPLTRQLLNPGERGYTQASLRNVAHNISLNDQSEGTSTIFPGGSILAPFIIANGNMQQILDSDASNDVPVYFNYIGANPDRVDHIRLLGNNTWGFEDIVGNGDQDFDDIVIQAKFQVVANV